MKKAILWILVIALILGGTALAAVWFILPWYNARSTMPADGLFILEEQPDGSMVLSWPEAEGADYYLVEIVVPGEEEQILFSDYAKEGTSYTLRELPGDQKVTLRVNSVVDYGKDKLRLGENPMEVTAMFTPPRVKDVEWMADPDTDIITIDYKMTVGDMIRVYRKLEDGSLELLKTVEEPRTEITFGENGEVPIPEYGTFEALSIDVCREQSGYHFFGDVSYEFGVTREDFLGRELALALTDEGKNVATLTWNETKGEAYQVQMRRADSEEWTVLGEIPADGERTFTTHHLPVVSDFVFRVAAVGGQTMDGGEYAAISDEVPYQTSESPIYATIWPMKNLKTYADPEMTEEVGSVKAAAAYCVLDEVGGAFRVGVNGKEVYIDSNYCMINLPEYMGELCSYEITNSYSSIYMVHEYAIPKVTDVVTAGYEYVQMADGEFLVPLLYRTAQKLVVAAREARSQGYRLKIYDAFRPNQATVQIYNLTESILDNPLPKKTFKGGVMYDLPRLPAKENEDDPDPIMTYRVVMTNNGGWQLGAFLAKGASMHNIGIALDLTLESLADGTELVMQTSMHDLSFYSIPARNNDNANLLNRIMTDAGMGSLVSEWWHFQDNETREAIQPPVVWAGVTPECWMKDDFGWKYRRYNGSYFSDGDFDIYGTVYTFDENGYIVN